MQQKRRTRALKAMMEEVGISERTLRRWRRWWQTLFARSGFWRGVRGLLRRPLAAGDLPLALLAAFEGSARHRLVALLRVLLPITTGTPEPMLAC